MDDIRIDRRRMMAGAAGLAASAFAGLPTLSAGEESDKKEYKGFLLGACDWTLGKMADPAAFEVAKTIGLDGVQVSPGSVNTGMKLKDPEGRKKFVEASKKAGVRISSLAIGALNQVPLKGDDPRPEKWIRESIEIARKLDQEVILLAFFGNGDILNDKAGRDVVIKKLRRLAPVAEDAGVVLGIESWLNADQHADMLDRIDSPAVQVYYDVGNMHKKGYDIYKEIRTLGGDRICEFHAKDYKDLYGKGSIDFPAVREAMDDIGYRGWFVIEGVKVPLGRVKSLRYDAEYLRKIFPRKV